MNGNKIMSFFIITTFIFSSLIIFNNDVSGEFNYNEYFENDLTTQKAYEEPWFNSTYTSLYFTPYSLGITAISEPMVFKIGSNQAGSIVGQGSFYFNITNDISSINFYYKYYNPSTGSETGITSYIRFMSINNLEMFTILYRQYPTYVDFMYYDAPSYIPIITIYEGDNWVKFNFDFTSSTLCNFSVFNGTTNSYMDGHIFGMGDYKENFRKINFYQYFLSASLSNSYIDNLQMIEGEETGSGSGTNINLKFYDGSTNEEIFMWNTHGGTQKPYQGINYYNGYCSITSDLFSGYYQAIDQDLKEINVTFNNGDGHYINITSGGSFFGYYDNTLSFIYLQPHSFYFDLFNNYTYNIILYPVGYEEYTNSEENILWDDQYAIFGIRTDKTSYNYPEQVRIEYKFPDIINHPNVLSKHGKSVNSFKIGIRDSGQLTLWDEDSERQKTYNPPFIFDGTWHNLPPFIPFDTKDGYDKLSVAIVEPIGWYLPGLVWTHAKVYINIYQSGMAYTPHGNFTNIIPSEPIVGETTQIYFNANNNGSISIIHLNTGDEIYKEPFDKPVGDGYITYIFNRNGQYLANLLVNTGITEQSVDTINFYVNGTGTGFEDWGSNTEYLTVENDRLIAGVDYLVILYKTLINDTIIKIDSPKNARAPFSTKVSNQTGGSYRVLLPSWCAIGVWNVSMNATEHLYDNFNIVAEENNYAEFIENSYIIGNPVNFYLRHNKRVKVFLLKDNIKYGSDLFFENGTIPEGEYGFPDTSFITEGLWTLQLWETNDRIPRKLLSEDIAYFEFGSVDSPEGDISNIFVISPPFSYFAGVFLVILFTLSPLLVVFMVSKATGNISFDFIPSFIYLVMGAIGFIISVILGFFPLWSVFVLLILGILIIVIIWLRNKDTGTNA